MGDGSTQGQDEQALTWRTRRNTDTEKMWSLTRSIYRYIGSPVATWNAHEHTVDEKMSIGSHLAVIAWIHTIVQNAVGRLRTRSATERMRSATQVGVTY